MTTGTYSAYARHADVSPAYVNKLKSQGRLVMARVGNKQVVDFEKTDELIHGTADLSKADSGVAAKVQAGRPAAIPISGERIDVMYRKAQVQERVYSAKIEELKYQEMAGELIRVDAVKSALALAFSSVREALLQLPARLAPLLAAETDTAAAQTLLHTEIHRALTQLAGAADRIGTANK